MRRLIATCLFVAAVPFAAPAEALTLRDIVELTKAGLSDDILVALIEVDKGVFAIDRETIKSLKADGVSERVMIAMIKSGRTPPPAVEPPPVVDPPAEPPAPQVVIIDHHEPRVREVAVPVPVYIPVVQSRSWQRYDSSTSSPSPGSPYYIGQVPVRAPAPRPEEPVYWGFGGKLRPDAWKPAGDDKRGDDQRGDGKGPDKAPVRK